MKFSKGFIFAGLLLILFVLLLIFIIDKPSTSKNGHTIYEDSQSGSITSLAIIRFIIEITNAEHLSANKNFISNIYEKTKELDDVWSEVISNGEYVRVTFEQDLTNKNDITIYPRVVSGNPRIEVYEYSMDDSGEPKDGTEIVAEFTSIVSEEYNKVFLTKFDGSQDTFDLKILNGSLEFDYIFDHPSIINKEVKVDEKNQ